MQAAANSAAVNELDVDGWRAFVANRTLDLGAARAGVAEFDAAATAVREAAIVARTPRAHSFLRIIMPPHTTRTNN